MRRERNKLYVISICAALALATIIAYEPMRHNGFVSYDDPKYITENPNVNRGITRQSVTWAFTKLYSANWHPLTWVSHMLDCQLFGLNPFWHHLVSLLFHIANALLLFWILTNITGAIWPSAFVAAAFALHPVQVDAIAWAAERKTVLSGFFWLLTMLAYIRYAQRPNLRRYSLVLLAFVMGLMAKPMLVTLPFVLLLLDWWPLDRFAQSRKESTAATQKQQKTSIGYSKATFPHLSAEKVPLLVLSALSSVITLTAQHSGGAIISMERVSLGYRIANMFVSYIKYIGKMIWPSRLAVFYPHPHANLLSVVVIICALLFVLITAISIHTGRRRKYVAVGWLWYVGTLVPVVGLIQTGSQAMANRYMYISMLGLLVIIAWAVKDLIANRLRWKIVAAGVTAVVLSFAVILTRMQVKHWQDSLTLFEYTLKVTENNAPAENNYGAALFKVGRFDEAVLHLSNAVRIMPAFAEARDNLCKVLLKQGKFDEAVACLNELIRRKQASADAYYNLAVVWSVQKKYDEAIKLFGEALKLDPNYPDAHRKMGAALLAAGRTNEAIAYLNEALRRSPDQPEACANLGIAYSQVKKYEPAIQNLTKAVKLKYNRPDVLDALAWLLATAGDVSAQDANRAVEYAQHACELTGHREPYFLDTLAAAYAAAGRFDDAIATAEQAVNAAKTNGQEELAGEIQKRMEQYKVGRPYHEK
ncbi:MAG: tetratricopeptide repeat protein [Sedimentisphaerales bacterium]